MRAVVFHLGMLRRLAAIGLLERVTGLSTVPEAAARCYGFCAFRIALAFFL